MRKFGFIIFLISLSLLFCAQFVLAEELFEVKEENGILRAGEGWSTEIHGVQVAYFTGTPLEIGMQHGLLVMDDPDAVREEFRALDPTHGAQGFWDRIGNFFRNLYARYQFYPAFKSHTPKEYLDEMKGFVLGASRGEDDDFYEIYMGNAFQELELAAPACSFFAAWGQATGDGGMYVGRNLDHAGMMTMAYHQYIGFYNPDQGYSFVVHNYPSMIGTMSGMNEKGLVIASNYSMVTEEEMTLDGLPYMLMLRQALQYSENIDEAIELIKETPRTIGLNILIADAQNERAVVVETSANRLQVREEENYIFASNQYHHPYMQELQAPGWLASHLRDERFKELKNENFGEIDAVLARDFMRDKFAPGTPAYEGFAEGIHADVSIASMVFSPDNKEVWVGVVDEEKLPLFPADNLFVGLDAEAVWETGSPDVLVDTLPPTAWEGHAGQWRKVRQAEYYISRWENEKALRLVQKVLADNPRAELPLLIAGRASMRLGDYEEAREYFAWFLDRENFAQAYYKMQGLFWKGLMLDMAGEREKAIAFYERSLQVEIPDMPEEAGGFRATAEMGLKTPLTIGEEGDIRSQ